MSESKVNIELKLLELQTQFPQLETAFGLRTKLISDPLLYATILKERERIETLLRSHPIDPPNNDEPSAFQVAIVMGDKELAAFYLKRGANPNKICFPDTTALILALETKQENMVEFLLNLEDIDVNYQGRGASAFSTAIKTGYCESSRLLLSSHKLHLRRHCPSFHQNGIFIAIARGDDETIKTLMKREDFNFSARTYCINKYKVYAAFGGGLDYQDCPGYRRTEIFEDIYISPESWARFLGKETLANQISAEESRREKNEEGLIQCFHEIGKELGDQSDNFQFFSYKPFREIVLEYLVFDTCVNKTKCTNESNEKLKKRDDDLEERALKEEIEKAEIRWDTKPKIT